MLRSRGSEGVRERARARALADAGDFGVRFPVRAGRKLGYPGGGISDLAGCLRDRAGPRGRSSIQNSVFVGAARLAKANAARDHGNRPSSRRRSSSFHSSRLARERACSRSAICRRSSVVVAGL